MGSAHLDPVPGDRPVLGRVLAALTGVGLYDDGTLASTELDDLELAELLDRAAEHRLLGALAQAVSTGLMPLRAAHRELVAECHNRWLARALLTEATLLQVDGCFRAHGIEYRVLKGVALCRTAYEDPSWRVFSDADVLVHTADFTRAAAVLRDDLGAHRSIPELRAGFDQEFGREVTMLCAGREIDLHRSLVDGAFGWTVRLDDLFAEPTWFELGGQPVAALGPTAAFVHACYDVALGDHPVRLSALRDLLVLHHRGVDVGEVVETASRWRGLAVVEQAARLAVDTLALPADHGLRTLTDLRSPRRQQWLLHSYGSRLGPYATHVASAAVLPGLGRRSRYLWAITHPSPEYLAARGWSRRGHLRRAVRRLTRSGQVDG